jgi:hypothetical protein
VSSCSVRSSTPVRRWTSCRRRSTSALPTCASSPSVSRCGRSSAPPSVSTRVTPHAASPTVRPCCSASAAPSSPSRSVSVRRRSRPRLLRAESLAHGVEAADVHLHELGRPRALARIVAIASALELLDVGRLTVGPVALGSGAVHIAHGRMAVPVPAVLHLMAGFVVESGPWPGELTTPSGAAVLAALATPAPGLPALTLECHGRGGAVVPGSSDMRVLTVLVGRDGSGATPQPPRR